MSTCHITKYKMKRQEQETVTSVESKQYRRAMANLPNDNKEALCGICGDAPVILNSAYKCATCAAPVCQKCFERVMRFEKIKWKWTHASAAKNLCFHPRHPDCYTRATMKIIRDTTSRSIQCEVCEHRQMKAEEREEEEEERPSTQPPSPEPCSIRFRCGNEQPPLPLGDLTVHLTEEEDEFEGEINEIHDLSDDDEEEPEDQTRCIK